VITCASPAELGEHTIKLGGYDGGHARTTNEEFKEGRRNLPQSAEGRT